MEDNKSNKSAVSRLNTELDVNLVTTVLKRNFLVPVILLVISLSVSFIYLRYTKPIYQSTAIIQRSSQDEGKRILDIESFEQENMLSEDVELLRSTFLLERALKNLNLEVSYFSEGDILTEEKYLLSSYHITILELKDSSLIGKQIFVENSGEQIKLKFSSVDGDQTVDVTPNSVVSNDYFDLIFKVSNEDRFRTSSKENSLYFVFNNYSTLTTQLHPHLEVFALNPEAKTIQVSFKSNNHKLSKDVVSSVINTFFNYDLDKNSPLFTTPSYSVMRSVPSLHLTTKSPVENFSTISPNFASEKVIFLSNG